MTGLAYDLTHVLSGSMVVVSFILLYENRISSLLRIFALHAFVLACSVAWQAKMQQAPHLYVTALIALIVKAGAIPFALRRIVRQLNIHREVEQIAGMGLTLLAGIALTALAVLVVLPITSSVASFTREDLAFALAVVLLGLLMMVSRHNVVSQVVGFMSMENGLVLAATGAKGMPLVVEISVAFSVLVAVFVFSIFAFRIRERFDSVDADILNRFREEAVVTTGIRDLFNMAAISAAGNFHGEDGT